MKLSALALSYGLPRRLIEPFSHVQQAARDRPPRHTGRIQVIVATTILLARQG
jgi:hypothetical protein